MIDTRKGLFVVAGCLVLLAAILSVVAPPLAGPVGYVGGALSILANVVPECVLVTVTVDARIDWVWGWGASSSVDIEVEFGAADT